MGNIDRMKVDLYLKQAGGLVIIAWARETNLGVYMGVRFSPEVENTSYFKDGERQLLRFPMMPDGKRRREEVPVGRQSPIDAIQRSELILGRLVNVACEAQSSPPAPKTSTGTTAITFDEDYLEGYPCLYYEAHIIHNGHAPEFLAEKRRHPAPGSDDDGFQTRLYGFDFFPEHSLALIIRRIHVNAPPQQRHSPDAVTDARNTRR